MDGARVSLQRFSFLAVWVVVVDIFQLPVDFSNYGIGKRGQEFYGPGWDGESLVHISLWDALYPFQ